MSRKSTTYATQILILFRAIFQNWPFPMPRTPRPTYTRDISRVLPSPIGSRSVFDHRHSTHHSNYSLHWPTRTLPPLVPLFSMYTSQPNQASASPNGPTVTGSNIHHRRSLIPVACMGLRVSTTSLTPYCFFLFLSFPSYGLSE